MSGTFTWISNPALLSVALLGATMLFMAACELQAPVSRASHTPNAVRSLPVLDDSVVIAAPPGYCIDLNGSRSERQDAFVLLASCRAVTGSPSAPAPAAPGVLTASVDGEGNTSLPDPDTLSEFFDSEIGRSALSRRSDPTTVSVGERRYRNQTYVLHVTEQTTDPVVGEQSWRAVFEVNGRLVTATLRELSIAPISKADGFRTVERFARDIRRSSRNVN